MELSAYIDSLPYGGRARVARAAGIAPAHLYQITAGIRSVPPKRVLDLSRATDYQVRPFDLRSDLYPDPDWLPPEAA